MPEISVAKNVSIVGPGAAALTIDGNGVSRVFHVAQGKTVTIAHLTVAHGTTTQGGGCVYNDNGSVTLDHVAVRECHAHYGGGVLNEGEVAAATMVIADSTIADSDTTTGAGGGVYNDGATATGNATLEVVRSTISGNAVPQNRGGGIFNDPFASGHAVVKIHASTISGNTALAGSTVPGNGGGVANGGFDLGQGTIQISNTTFTGNVAVAGNAIANETATGGVAVLEIGSTILDGGSGTILNAGGALTSRGFNLARDAVGGDAGTAPGGLLAVPGDQRNVDPLLGTLQDNGGPTRTHAPSSGSPAIDHGKRDTIGALVDVTDQRGLPRPSDDDAVANGAGSDGSDVGAFEVQPVADLAVTQLKPPAKVTLTAKAPAVTKKVKVRIQNRGASPETIPDQATLDALVDVAATALGAGCAPPPAVLASGHANKVPRTLKSKQKLTVVFTATFACANDPAKTSKKDPGHDDFRWVASVHGGVLGTADAHAADDVCPHPALPGGVDQQPGVKKPIKDKGCGGKLPDKTLGADVTTDVVVK